MKNENAGHLEELVEAGVHQDALALVDALIEEAREQAKPWADRGWVLFKMGDYAAALRSFTEALSRHPNGATTLFFRAQCRERIGDLQGALDDYRSSLAISPRADVLVNIGLLLKYRGEHPSARTAFSEALKLEPANELASALLMEADSLLGSQ